MNVANQGVSFCHPIPTIRGRSSALRTLGVSLLPQGITHHPPLGDSVTLHDTPLLKQSLPGPGKATAGLTSPLPPLPTAPRLLTEDCAHPIPTEAAVRSLIWQNFTVVQGHLSRAYLVFSIRSLQYNHSSHIRMRTVTPFPVSKAFRICSMVLWSIFAHLFNIILSLKSLPPSTILVLYTSCAGKGKGKKSFHSQTHTSCAPSCMPTACISRLGLLRHKPGGLRNRNVLSQTNKKKEMYYPVVFRRLQNPKSRCQQGRSFWGPWAKDLSQAPPFGPQMAISSLCLSTLPVLCVCLSPAPNVPLLWGYQSYWIRTHPNDLILIWWPLWQPWISFWGGEITWFKPQHYPLIDSAQQSLE